MFCTVWVYIWADYYPVAIAYLSCFIASDVMVPTLPTYTEYVTKFMFVV